ncbi:MAG: glycosyltransferase family 4 protein [Lachnospiraceae bacterium]|nr:glycosyltransferase family 4 protein [Lachnospiraceae bacterium]
MKQEHLKEIVMIGPVYPYKGGIAHYTALLCRALRNKYHVEMISYKMQYPKILFKKEQKDFSNDAFKLENTEYLIHTANPFNCIAVARKIRKKKPDLVIVQWWHPYFAPCYWIMEKVLGKKTKILFVCHNVFPHERFPMDKALTRLVLKNGDCFITQSGMDSDDLQTIKRDARYCQTVHPTYNAFKLKNLTKSEGRDLLSIASEEKILLFFGFVREYKGLSHIIKALPEIVEKVPGARLFIVGDFDGDKEKYLQMIQENQVEKNVSIFDGYIPDNEVEKFFAACDLVVLPYESATQSGIVQIAYGFEKPVVVTNVGGLPEVVEDGKTGYVVEPRNEGQLADAVVRFFNEKKADGFQENIQKEAYRYSWDRMVEVVERLYQDSSENE